MIEKFKNTWEKFINYFLFNIQFNFSINKDSNKNFGIKNILKFSFYSFLCIQFVGMLLPNILYLLNFDFILKYQEDLTYESLAQIKYFGFFIYLLTHYPINQFTILILVSLYLGFLISAYVLADYLFGDSDLNWSGAAILGFTSYLPWQFTMSTMSLSYVFFLVNGFPSDHYLRQWFVIINTYLLLFSFLLTFYLAIKNAGIISKLKLRKRILISLFPCILFILIAGILTSE
ncbi:hypothetical protein EHQ43_01530 [Leptospira bouyouniensis]|uniref:Uncharacterized protein n=1 Tax=Leptospira bouyouniensis TaxID=2484911 RepID=A0A7I0HWQ8_9LEPT|nr:hypothetical protein [Leptospira bouyouniensis]TGL09164.1 hypothetical protein EHQ43_01530 [Leptospira bouyouniensis]